MEQEQEQERPRWYVSYTLKSGQFTGESVVRAFDEANAIRIVRQSGVADSSKPMQAWPDPEWMPRRTQ